MMVSIMTEKRSAERHPIYIHGELRLHKKRVSVEVVNLSTGGVGISCDAPLLVGATVDVVLHIQKHKRKPTELCLKGRVVWCNEHIEVGFVAGIQFTAVERSTKDVLDDLSLELHAKTCRLAG